MEIEVVAIGNEILSGEVINTNASFIGKRLVKEGYMVARQSTFGDNPSSLKEGFKEALGRSSLVIATGGLGPTCDDLTRDVAAEIFISNLHFDERVAKDLRKRFGDRPISLESQATVPDKAVIFLNTVGTAPGLLFKEELSTLILLPGVPQEMKVMFERSVLPYILEHFPLSKQLFQKRITFSLLSESEVDPLLRSLEKQYPQVQFGIYPSYGVLTVSLTSNNEDMLNEAAMLLEKKYQEHYFSSPSETLEELVHLELIKKKKTLALAESITGGMMASQLTAFPGASQYFLGSCVVYSNQLKQTLLHVPEKTLQDHGAVSEETVKAMLEGLLEITKADFGIAVTGIAGPAGATENKPVGTVWGAVGALRYPPFVEKFQGLGNRETIMLYSCRRLFAQLLTYIKHHDL